MVRIKPWAPLLLSAAALGVSAPSALGANPNSNGCNGNIVARNNHVSGIRGASGNPKASAGPGFFKGGDFPGSVPAAIAGKRSACP
jgi:hypothetical protein